MSDRMLAAINAIAKGERCTVPAMKVSQFDGFMKAIRSEQKKLAVQ